MRRREFITLFSGVVAGGPMVARAQQQKLPVISFLNSGSPAEWDDLVLAFNYDLNEAGFTVGRNVSIDYRWARLQYDRLPELVIIDQQNFHADGLCRRCSKQLLH